MKNWLITLVCLLSFDAIGQQAAEKMDVRSWTPPYNLVIPEGWTTERFPIPIDFAPQIPYKGVEDLRFAPGWSDQASEDYWSYTFLWWLEGSPVLNAASLQKNLTDYYSGLVARNIASRNIPADKVIPTKAVIEKTKETTPGTERYSGSITLLDYMSQLPITFHCLIQVQQCKDQQRTAVLVEISPKPFEHVIWQKLHVMQLGFSCVK